MNNNSKSQEKTWNGIPRNQIKWYPTIDQVKCINCLSCVSFCKQGVYSNKEGKSVVENPNNCVVGCVGCERICPVGAISHPPKKTLDKVSKTDNNPTSCCSHGSCCGSKK